MENQIPSTEEMKQDDEIDSPNYTGVMATTVNYINMNIDTLHEFKSSNQIYSDQHEFKHKTILHHQSTANCEVSPPIHKRSLMRKILHFKQCAIGDTTHGLKTKLVEFYREATLPCITWLNKGQDLLMTKYYTELQLDTSDTTIVIDEIFAKVDKKKPKRILIEGQPGYGKTTLATKIVHDWALSKNYIKHFKLIFMLPLRELHQRSLNEAITAITTNHCGFDKVRDVRAIIQENAANTLLILDGLDELAANQRLSILKLLYKQAYAEITVIVTCRTGLFTLEPDELNILFGGISKKKVFYDKKIRVLGIEDRRKFLAKFSPHNSADDIIGQIEKLTKPVADMFKSPLFLILLVFIASKKSDMSTLVTKTDLFKRLFNCIVRHSLKNYNIVSPDNDFDLFKYNSPINNIQLLIQQFGKESMEHILNNNMQFECNQLTSEIYKMGFLINHKEISFFESTCHYEAFHLSILEFAAAFSIWMDFKQHNFRLPGKCLQCIQPLYFRLGKTSLILKFLAGLLQDEAYEFFQQLSSHAHMFSSSEDSLWHLLAECQENSSGKKLLPVLVDFIPPHIHHYNEVYTNMNFSHFFEKLMQFGIENGRIKQIYINNVNPSKLAKNVVIPRLWINIQPDVVPKLDKSIKSKQCENRSTSTRDSSLQPSMFSILENSLNGVRCQKLALRFNAGFNEIPGDNEIWNYIRLLASTPHESCSMCMDGFAIYNKMSEYIDHPIVTKMKFSSLRIHISDLVGKNLITTFLQRNQVESLQLLLSCFSPVIKLNDILNAATNSPVLHSLQITGNLTNSVSINLYQLTKGGTKNYKCLTVKGNSIICTKPLEDKNCIHTLIIKEVHHLCHENITSQNSQALAFVNPTVLECQSSHLDKLPSSWTGYATLKELALSIDDSSNNTSFWKCLTECKNLKMLELIFPVHRQLHSALPIDDIIKCLQQLPIQRLALWRIKTEYNVTKNLVKNITDSLPWTIRNDKGENLTHPLKTIDLISLFTGEDDKLLQIICSIITDLLECLRLNYLKSVNIICSTVSLWHSLMQRKFIDHSVFQVTHLIHGSSDDEPEYYKMWYNGFSFFSYNTFCIRLK